VRAVFTDCCPMRPRARLPIHAVHPSTDSGPHHCLQNVPGTKTRRTEPETTAFADQQSSKREPAAAPQAPSCCCTGSQAWTCMVPHRVPLVPSGTLDASQDTAADQPHPMETQSTVPCSQQPGSSHVECLLVSRVPHMTLLLQASQPLCKHSRQPQHSRQQSSLRETGSSQAADKSTAAATTCSRAQHAAGHAGEGGCAVLPANVQVPLKRGWGVPSGV
jgi:hypothetical protein